MNNVTS